jgi:hypothetical protein
MKYRHAKGTIGYRVFLLPVVIHPAVGLLTAGFLRSDENWMKDEKSLILCQVLFIKITKKEVFVMKALTDVWKRYVTHNKEVFINELQKREGSSSS